MPANLGFAFTKALFTGKNRSDQTTTDQDCPSKPKILLIDYSL